MKPQGKEVELCDLIPNSAFVQNTCTTSLYSLKILRPEQPVSSYKDLDKRWIDDPLGTTVAGQVHQPKLQRNNPYSSFRIQKNALPIWAPFVFTMI